MRTILVLGIGASGTSCVAGCLHKLGCPMGPEGHLDKAGRYEDVCFYGAFREPINWERLLELIDAHEQPPVWGWKNTLTMAAIPRMFDLLENPHVVAVHRNLLASVRGRRDGRCPPGQYFTQQQAERWAIEAMRQYMGALQAAAWHGVPTLHIGFEDTLANPEETVEELAEFAFEDAPRDMQEAVEHIQPELVTQEESDE